MLSTLDAVRRSGIDVAVVAPPAGPLSQVLAARGVELVPFAFGDAAGSRLAQGRLREKLARLLARRRPDLLHANSLSMSRMSGPVASELTLPSLGHLRDMMRLSPQAVADLSCHTRLLAVSEAVRGFHTACGLASNRVYVVYNGVDLEEFCPHPESGYVHRQLGLSPEVRLVGTIGQICLRKGQDVLLEAAAVLADELPQVHWLIVGQRWSEKPESRWFEADLHAAATGNLAGRVHFLGFRNDVSRIMNELCVLAHPARQEPLGRVLLEAAAAGVPVVATDVGGTREIFPPEAGAARLVAAGDPHAMAGAILQVLGDQSLRRRMQEAARRRAEESFDVEHAAANLAEHYRQLTAF